MAQSFAHRTPSQNPPLGGKNKLNGTALTKGNDMPAVSRAPTPAATLPVVSALSSIVQYLEDDF